MTAEDLLRRVLHESAANVEPSADAYARLVERMLVEGAQLYLLRAAAALEAADDR